MYDIQTIKTGLLGLIGYRQNIDPTGTQLSEMTTSESGLFYNNAHPLLTFGNLLSIAPQFDLLAATTATFTDWLKERTEQGIIQALNFWLENKVKKNTARNLLTRSTLFETTGNFVDLIDVKDYRVGFEIIPLRSNGVVQRITQVGLQFTQNQTIPIKLFQSGKLEPIFSFDFVYTGGGSVQWFDLSTLDAIWSMKGGASYYLSYDLNTIVGNPINGVYDYALGLDSSRFGRLDLFTFNRFFGVHGYKTSESFVALGDLTKNQYDYSTNYGVNLKFDARTDYTDFILEQKSLFTTAIQKQVAINLIQELGNNSNARANRNEGNVNWEKVQFALRGDTQTTRKQFGLYAEFYQAIDAIQFDTTGIDNAILPVKRRGTRFTTI